MIRKLLALSVFGAALLAQGPTTPGSMYHRVYAVVPMIGGGTYDDPRRPMFVPATPGGPDSGLLAHQMVMSDNGQVALVELVFSTPAAYRDFLAKVAAAQRIAVATTPTASDGPGITAATVALEQAFQTAVPGLQLYTRGKATKAQIETAFQQYKQGFTLDAFQPVRVQ